MNTTTPPGTATGDAAAGTQPAGQPLASGGTVTVELDPDGDALAPVDRTVTRANGCEISAWDTSPRWSALRRPSRSSGPAARIPSILHA